MCIFQGLIKAVQTVMPGADHRTCVWHLWQNFNKHWKDRQLKQLLWQSARATTSGDFDIHYNRIKALNQAAWEWLEGKDKKTWSKALFSEWPKVDNITNNNCEVFNAKILGARSKPIVQMLEDVRLEVMNTMSNNKLKLERYVGHLPPVQRSRLERIKKDSIHWTAHWSGINNPFSSFINCLIILLTICHYVGDDAEEKFEVHRPPLKVSVNLGKQTCTCRFWQLTGKNVCWVLCTCACLIRIIFCWVLCIWGLF